MELITQILPRTCTIYDMSDLHVGSPNCALETLQSVIDEVKRKKAYLIFKGDAIEAITPGDKRYTNSCVMDEYKSPKHQADKVIEMFKPVASRILAWGTGNHELKLQNVIDFGRYIAEALQVPYGTYVFKLMIQDNTGATMFKTYHTHGMGGVNSNAKDDIQYEANRKAALKHKLVKSGHSDCIYMSRGHDHQLIVVEPTVQNKLYLTSDTDNIRQHYHQQVAQNASYIPPDSRWYATTGSFRKLHSEPGLGVTDYSEMAGFAPSEIGFARIQVKDGQITTIEKVVA